MSIKEIGIILILTMIASSIATITNCINIALAQRSSTNIGRTPQPSVASSSSPGSTPQPEKNPAPAANVTAPAVSTPPKRIIIGPSIVNASPVTNEIQGNTSATSVPSNTGTFLGTPPSR